MIKIITYEQALQKLAKSRVEIEKISPDLKMKVRPCSCGGQDCEGWQYKAYRNFTDNDMNANLNLRIMSLMPLPHRSISGVWFREFGIGK